MSVFDGGTRDIRLPRVRCNADKGGQRPIMTRDRRAAEPGSGSQDQSPRRRMPAAVRRMTMALGAADFLAANGFEASTRDIAEALGVTQALIYKYFKSKEALIDEALAAAFGDRLGGSADRLYDTSRPFADRLADFYVSFVAGTSETRMRLFMRAALDGRKVAQRH